MTVASVEHGASTKVIFDSGASDDWMLSEAFVFLALLQKRPPPTFWGCGGHCPRNVFANPMVPKVSVLNVSSYLVDCREGGN